MARCGCQSSQCSCVLVAGNGVTITGNGNPDDPYEIGANAGALAIADTPTVDLTLTGTGSGSNPYELAAAVIVDPAAGNLLTAGAGGLGVSCESVQDCVGQGVEAGQGLGYNDTDGTFSARPSTDVGNAVTFGADGGLFAAGVGAAIETGCGITGAGTEAQPLAINTPAWVWPCDADIVGEPLGCGDGGLLYGPPVQRVWQALFGGGALTWVPPGGTSAATTQPFSLDLTNPDTCRTMIGIAHISVSRQLSMAAASEVTVNVSGDTQHRFRNDSPGIATLFHRMQYRLPISIAPSGLQTLSWTVGGVVAAGSATIIQDVCSVRVLAVGQ